MYAHKRRFFYLFWHNCNPLQKSLSSFCLQRLPIPFCLQKIWRWYIWICNTNQIINFTLYFCTLQSAKFCFTTISIFHPYILENEIIYWNVRNSFIYCAMIEYMMHTLCTYNFSRCICGNLTICLQLAYQAITIMILPSQLDKWGRCNLGTWFLERNGNE